MKGFEAMKVSRYHPLDIAEPIAKRLKVSRCLPLDLAELIAKCLLADDVVDYISFRAVCKGWRSRTASPRSLASCFRPRHWLMLTDGDANLHMADRRRFFNLRSGRSLLLRLPELDSHTIFTATDGLLILVDNSTRIVRIFNPFTRYLIDLPPLPTLTSSSKLEILAMIKGFNISISGGDCPTAVLFSLFWQAVYFAKPGDLSWKSITLKHFPNSFLFFNDKWYFTDYQNGIHIFEPDLKSVKLRIPKKIPDSGGLNNTYYLLEYNSDIFLINRNWGDKRPIEHTDYKFNIFRVNLEANQLILIDNIGDLTLLVGFKGRNLVLSSKDLPSIKGNSIYFLTGVLANPIAEYNLDDRQIKSIAIGTVLHDGQKRIGPSIRPFTLFHHLAAYGSTLLW